METVGKPTVNTKTPFLIHPTQIVTLNPHRPGDRALPARPLFRQESHRTQTVSLKRYNLSFSPLG